MTTQAVPPLWEIEFRVMEITSEQSSIPLDRIRPDSRVLEDLHIDSLGMVELILSLEERFQVTIPDDIGKEMLSLAEVQTRLGISPFGLHHMAGNIWQWCADWYAANFYSRAEASHSNPLNSSSTGIRSERGGSWIGPAELTRSSYRRGRPPAARGRCLGFRCVGLIEEILVPL